MTRSTELVRFSKMTQLTPCNSEVILREITTDYWVGFKKMQNNVPKCKSAGSLHAIPP